MPIRNLQHVALAVPDLEVGRKFYSDFGLDVQERDNQLICRCDGRDQDQIQLIEGSPKKLHHLCFGTNEDELPTLQAAIEKAGGTMVDAPKDASLGDGLWFQDFEGMLFNIKAAEDTPWDTSMPYQANLPGEKLRINRRHELADFPPIRPRRLGHVVLFSSDPERKMKFFEETMAARVSDRIADFMIFCHMSTGSDHHVFAFIKSHAPGFQHAAFEVANSDEVAYGGARLLDKGYLDAWGPGRHTGPGSNLFHYLRDPWMSMCEYFADIDYIPEGSNWEAMTHIPGGEPDFWGGPPPVSFGKNFEALNMDAR